MGKLPHKTYSLYEHFVLFPLGTGTSPLKQTLGDAHLAWMFSTTPSKVVSIYIISKQKVKFLTSRALYVALKHFLMFVSI